MASGFFPLRKDEEDGKKLERIAGELREIREGLWSATCESCTPEDAATDGSYLERISLAEDFIRYCLRS